MRRFVEVVFWVVYFTDHPREWAEFCRKPAARMRSHQESEPINGAAHQTTSYYAAYGKELFAGEPSGLAAKAVAALYVEFTQLSATVHPAQLVTSGEFVPPFDLMLPKDLERLNRDIKKLCRDGIVVVAAFAKRRFDRLSAVQRAWFDWLVGSVRTEVRGGPFGLD